MGKVEYSPKALEDLQKIKAYIIENFGVDAAQKALVKITGSVS
ncbi:plasmid stabilization system protein [Desulfosporosinus orientis DSM 765]|uniref:Plasmid stabilization system protein n=1 Tax=Desulfosporosinus orientis (strain ATCC 19365 / DSM 765 / NCIMB 8382 / VKM B-1628 / Singapore I) TaxID=768706 RepID=G7WJ57_DESOD